ncbi:hypothetical protein ACFODO_07805 [Acinetobacter sichuanensis]|uniref:Uncharacterized protein n=1 Tax=Acinetobacter sichuanensis TaxID=2136183 RepID=A0A371YK06_9GAMM|nr:hypothetical protein [Acinetobacter sichuanensis]RFC81795.1 hypothetical protein C9E89_019810 [Acinetobacter sichuanensis]
MNIDQEKFDEMFSNFEKISKGRGYFFYKFEYYKHQIERCLRSDDDSEVIFGIYLTQELSEEQQIDLLEPLVDIFIGDIGLSFRVGYIFNSLRKDILINEVKNIISKKKHSYDYVDVNIILNFYKEIDINTSLFFCDVFRELNDSDINECIDDFLEGLEEAKDNR